MKLFHIIDQNQRLGHRNGIVIRRNAKGVQSIFLIWHITGSTQRLLPSDHGGGEALGYPVFWAMLAYSMPKAFCAKKDLLVKRDGGVLRYCTEDLPGRDGSLASYVGELAFRRGVFGATGV